MRHFKLWWLLVVIPLASNDGDVSRKSVHSNQAECVDTGLVDLVDGKPIYTPVNCMPRSCEIRSSTGSAIDGFTCTIGNDINSLPEHADACQDIQKALESVPRNIHRGRQMEAVCLPKLASISWYMFSCKEFAEAEVSLAFTFDLPTCGRSRTGPNDAVMVNLYAKNESIYYTIHPVCRVFHFGDNDLHHFLPTESIQVSSDCMGFGLQHKIYYYLSFTSFPYGAVVNYTIMYQDVAKGSMQLVAAARISTQCIHVVFLPIEGVTDYIVHARGAQYYFSKKVSSSSPSVEMKDIPSETSIITVRVTPIGSTCSSSQMACSPIEVTLHDRTLSSVNFVIGVPQPLPQTKDKDLSLATVSQVVGVVAAGIAVIGLVLLLTVRVYQRQCSGARNELKLKVGSINGSFGEAQRILEQLPKGFTVTDIFTNRHLVDGEDLQHADVLLMFIHHGLQESSTWESLKNAVNMILDMGLEAKTKVVSLKSEGLCHVRPSEVFGNILSSSVLASLDGATFCMPQDLDKLVKDLKDLSSPVALKTKMPKMPEKRVQFNKGYERIEVLTYSASEHSFVSGGTRKQGITTEAEIHCSCDRQDIESNLKETEGSAGSISPESDRIVGTCHSDTFSSRNEQHSTVVNLQNCETNQHQLNPVQVAQNDNTEAEPEKNEAEHNNGEAENAETETDATEVQCADWESKQHMGQPAVTNVIPSVFAQGHDNDDVKTVPIKCVDCELKQTSQQHNETKGNMDSVLPCQLQDNTEVKNRVHQPSCKTSTAQFHESEVDDCSGKLSGGGAATLMPSIYHISPLPSDILEAPPLSLSPALSFEYAYYSNGSESQNHHQRDISGYGCEYPGVMMLKVPAPIPTVQICSPSQQCNSLLPDRNESQPGPSASQDQLRDNCFSFCHQNQSEVRGEESSWPTGSRQVPVPFWDLSEQTSCHHVSAQCYRHLSDDTESDSSNQADVGGNRIQIQVVGGVAPNQQFVCKGPPGQWSQRPQHENTTTLLARTAGTTGTNTFEHHQFGPDMSLNSAYEQLLQYRADVSEFSLSDADRSGPASMECLQGAVGGAERGRCHQLGSPPNYRTYCSHDSRNQEVLGSECTGADREVREQCLYAQAKCNTYQQDHLPGTDDSSGYRAVHLNHSYNSQCVLNRQSRKGIYTDHPHYFHGYSSVVLNHPPSDLQDHILPGYDGPREESVNGRLVQRRCEPEENSESSTESNPRNWSGRDRTQES